MNKLWKFLQSRLNKIEKLNPDLPFLHEVIDFKVFPDREFQEWQGRSSHALMQQRLRKAFFNYQMTGLTEDAAFEFFSTLSSNGFALFQRKTYTLKLWDYRFLQHDIALKLKDMGYILKLSDVRSRTRGNGVEQIFRYYLKPSSRLKEGVKARQLYGNVSIEVILRDDNPYMIKCLANTYNDQHFHPALPFEELIGLIVK